VPLRDRIRPLQERGTKPAGHRPRSKQGVL
jgi:hypothetical protein